MSEAVLVTGANGFVAGWCIVELLRRGYRVRATVRSAGKEAPVFDAIRRAGADTGGLSLHVAELLSDEGWDEAMAGCEAVLHVASPMGGDDPELLIAAARDGAVRVIRAAQRAGVGRVVMTSSLAAASPEDPEGLADEAVWTDPGRPELNAYRRSKILAEQAAWQQIAQSEGTTLTTLLPGAIFGPVMRPDQTGSIEVIARMLAGRPPGLPRIVLSITDVRDLAAMHVQALITPEAAGERFIVVGERVWMAEAAEILRSALGNRAPKIPRRVLPDGLVRVASWFLPPLRQLVPMLGRSPRYASEKAVRTLGYSPRPAAETLVDCAESLLAREP